MNLPKDFYLNFHAHQQVPADDEMVIQSLFLQDHLTLKPGNKIFYTAGLHPWHADLLTLNLIEKKLEDLILNKKIVAIGETGLDKLKGGDWKTQLSVFQKHIEISEKYQLPLVIHSVKAHNEILKLKKDTDAKSHWVIHNFTGSRQLAMDLIEHGFYLSVGHHIKNGTSRINQYFKHLPKNKIFLETDDFDISIKELYQVAADKWDVGIQALKMKLISNLQEFLKKTSNC
ncbi:MAG: TatD family hydrolase [Bacteroidales bacterium]|jgi:TatD DNase family protein|nr:TatD family hydrolase [Bacteroidales bacterium]